MSASIKKPEIIVFAGPNGSGKSTFTELLRPPVDYINADEIKINLKCSDLAAALTRMTDRFENPGGEIYGRNKKRRFHSAGRVRL